MNDLLKEAIADAKAVRETAIANAKLALEEAFTPKLQSMLSAKIQNEMDGDEELDTDELDAELAVGEDVEDDGEFEEEEEELDVDLAAEAEGDEVAGDELEIEDEEEVVDDDLDLEAVIRELEADEEDLEEDDDYGEGEGDEKSDDRSGGYGSGPKSKETDEEEGEIDYQEESTGVGKGDNKVDQAKADTQDPGKGKLSEEDEDDEEIDLDEIIAALQEEEDEEDYLSDDPAHIGSDLSQAQKSAGISLESKTAKLKEAYHVIKFLKGKINEVNLLNAKLLYSNKLFRSYRLNETQKIKIIENFDRATTLREVKLVYTTIAESFGNTSKRSVNEGFASKPVASTAPRKEILSEGDDLAGRFKKLAGLIK